MASLIDIGLSAAINVASALLFLLLFKVLKTQPANDRVYFPKLYLNGLRQGGKRRFDRSVTKYFNLDYHAYWRLLDWCRPAIQMSEGELIDHAGLDTAIFLRVFILGLKMFIPIMLLGLLVLVPVNYADKQLLDASQALDNTKALFSANIDKLSMSNIAKASPRLWAPLVMSYVFTAWACFVMYVEYKKVVAMRLRFNAAEEHRPDQFTVLVQRVPSSPNETVSQRVDRFFRSNHRDHYLSHQVAVDANKLAGVVKDKEKVQNWLDYEELKYARNPTRRPTTRTGFGGCWGKRVDAINFYTSKVEQMKQQVANERALVLSSEDATMPAAFVFFKTRWGAAVCAQTQQTRDPTLWLTNWAPEPRDVYWPNLAIPYASLYIRKLLIAGATFLLIFFYMIPVSAVQLLANLDGLERTATWLRPVIESPIKPFLQGFLPGFALKLFLLLLPRLLMLMSKVEGWLALSVLDRKAAAKMYYFMVVNVFLGSIFAGLGFKQWTTFANQPPSQIPIILGQAIPIQGTFFITFIMVDGWAAVAGAVGFDEVFPQLELYFLMGIVYSVITPLILPFVVIFFAFGYVVYRHQAINVYDQEYESAGAFWPHIHGRIIASILLEHVMLIGLFSSKEAPSSTPFLIGLPVLTILFHLYCKSRFEPAFRKYPLEEAVAKDNLDINDSMDWDPRQKYFQDSYLHPIFKLDDEAADDKDKEQPDESAEAPGNDTWTEDVPDSVPLTGSPVVVSHMGTQTSFNRQDSAAGAHGLSNLDKASSPAHKPIAATPSSSPTINMPALEHSSPEIPGRDGQLVATRRHQHSQGAIGHDDRTDCSCAYCLL